MSQAAHRFITLVLIAATEVLPKLYGEVVIPPAVHRELQHNETPGAVRDWLDHRPTWLSVQDPGDIEPGLEKLGLGEAQAITLAKQLRADHLLIDERDGTKAARRLDLHPLSLLAVLDRAGARGLIDVREKTHRLQTQTTYRMTQALADALLANDAERRRREASQRAGP